MSWGVNHGCLNQGLWVPRRQGTRYQADPEASGSEPHPTPTPTHSWPHKDIFLVADVVCGQKKMGPCRICLGGWWGLLFNLGLSKSTSQLLGDFKGSAEGPVPLGQVGRKLEPSETQVVTRWAEHTIAAPGGLFLKTW